MTRPCTGAACWASLAAPRLPIASQLEARHTLTPRAPRVRAPPQNTRSCMKRAGLPTPANHLIRSGADCAAAAEAVGFPAVIKPISGAASEGVVRVDSLAQLEKRAFPPLPASPQLLLWPCALRVLRDARAQLPLCCALPSVL